MQNLKYVGIYGNSNPHYLSDWVLVEDESSSSAASSLVGRTCSFSGGYNLRFYVTKLGTEDNPQYKISRVKITPQRITWTHNKIDDEGEPGEQDFMAYLSISFHEVDTQSKSEFTPKPPNKLPKLSGNVLYPFFIYDE